MEVRGLFGRFVWRRVNIADVTIHPSRGSSINPTLKVCEHNRVTHASQGNMFEQKIHKALSNKAYNYNTFQQDLY